MTIEEDKYIESLLRKIEDVEIGLRYYIKEYQKYKLIADNYAVMYEHSVDERIKLMHEQADRIKNMDDEEVF